MVTPEGAADFLSGIGLLMCFGTGLVCALSTGSKPGSTFVDPADIRSHWRGIVKIGLSLIVVGLVARLALALV